MASNERRRRVLVIGGGVHGLSTAINIQENIPNVEVELVVIDQGTAETTGDTNRVVQTSCVEFQPNLGDNLSGHLGHSFVDERRTSSNDIMRSGSVIDHEVVVPDVSMKTTSRQDIWAPQCVPGMEDTGNGGYFRFWAVLTWQHLHELTQREDPCFTGVSLHSDYRLWQMKNNTIGDWWKDLVPGYRSLPEREQGDSISGLRNGVSFTTIVIDYSIYLPYLVKRFNKAGGRMSTSESLMTEVSRNYDLLVNCSGLDIGSMAVSNSFPATIGQNILLPNSTYQDMPPRSRGLQGFCIEAETVNFRGRILPVVHNYGYTQTQLTTLHWGCALEASRLVSDILAGRRFGFRITTSKL